MEELAAVEGAGGLLHSSTRDNAITAIDRDGLAAVIQDGLVPVVHLGRADGIAAVLTGFPLRWAVAALWCTKEEAERRLKGRGDPQIEQRLMAWDQTLADYQASDLLMFDLSINTVKLCPKDAAALIARTVALAPRSNPTDLAIVGRTRRLFGRPRFVGYLQHCGGNETAALEFYQWNAATSAALWEVLGHVEVALRNALAARLNDRHRRKGRRGSWLDDLAQELDPTARQEIATARGRVARNGRRPAKGRPSPI